MVNENLYDSIKDVSYNDIFDLDCVVTFSGSCKVNGNGRKQRYATIIGSRDLYKGGPESLAVSFYSGCELKTAERYVIKGKLRYQEDVSTKGIVKSGLVFEIDRVLENRGEIEKPNIYGRSIDRGLA